MQAGKVCGDAVISRFSKEGLLRLCSLNTPEGDEIVVFDGAETPFILRRANEEKGIANQLETSDEVAECQLDEQWILIGSCYVHGFMNGEFPRPEYDDRENILDQRRH
jgi:hypothetical protein